MTRSTDRSINIHGGLPRSLTTLALAVVLLLVGALAARAEYRLEREFELGRGGELLLKADSGAVELRGVAGTEARVLITSRYDDIEDRYDIDFVEGPGRLEISAKRRGSVVSRWFGWRGSLRFEIEVPSDTAVRLATAGGSLDIQDIGGEVNASTSGGWIKARDLGASAKLDTSGGSIGVERVAGDLSVDTSGGAISIEDVGGEVDAETSGGSVTIKGVGGRVRASSSGGPITAYFSPGNFAGGTLSTSGGRVTAYVDPAAALDLDLSTSGGRAVVDMPVMTRGSTSRSSFRGELNGGGELLRLRSSGGSVSVKPL